MYSYFGVPPTPSSLHEFTTYERTLGLTFEKSIVLQTQHRKHGSHVGPVERGHIHGANASHIRAAERLVERGRGRRAAQCCQQRGRAPHRRRHGDRRLATTGTAAPAPAAATGMSLPVEHLTDVLLFRPIFSKPQ